jgi:NTP pyrophosphatase (non-canonical NTP hydrolase)
VDDSVSVGELKGLVRAFCEERDWDQFHGPKDLAIGIVTEASELLGKFRFVSDDAALSLLTDRSKREAVEAETSDVLFFVLRFAQRLEIDLDEALRRKLATNADRYPIDKARGSNRKDTEL